MKAFIAGIAVAAAIVSSAEAKSVFHPECNITMPCIGAPPAYAVPAMVKEKRYATRSERLETKRAARGKFLQERLPIGAPMAPGESVSRFIRGGLKCAINVNAALAARGIRGTGSAWAKDFLTWGRASGPQVGAIAVFNRGRRGGHVAIVHDVRPDGTVIYLNPSSRRQTWQVGPYHKQPIAFRVAS